MKLLLYLAFPLFLAHVAFAQTSTSGAQPTARQSVPPLRISSRAESYGGGAYGYLYRFQATCAVGATSSTIDSKVAGMCGVGSIILPLFMTEVGVMGPQAHHSQVSAYLSEDLVLPIAPAYPSSWGGHPLILGGYTRMFETGHALDYGIGYERPMDGSHSFQVELRDYYAFANPNMHNVFLRLVWTVGVPN